MAFGGTVKLTGESEYRKAIKNITSDLKGMSKSLKEQATAFSTSDKSLDKSTKNQEELNKALKEQEKQLANAKRSYAQYGVEIQTQTTRHNALSKEYKAAVLELDKIKKASGESSEEYKKQSQIVDELGKELAESSEKLDENKRAQSDLKKVINDSEKTIQQTKDAIEDYNKQLEKNGKEQKEALTPMQSLNKAMDEQEKELSGLKEEYKNAVSMYGKNSSEAKNLASEIDKLSGELADNKKKMNDLDSAADELDNSLKDVETSTGKAKEGFTVMKGVLANLATQAINKTVSGLKNFASQTLEAGMNFESSMAEVASVSGATGKDLEKLTEKAKEMGSKTKFSATESAEAFNYMAMAGWKTGDMIDGIEGIMNLAAASGEDLATTSDIVTDALTAMGYSAGDAGKLADVMAAASSNANTNVAMMGETFKYAAPVAGALGYSMEDVSVAIGLMANSGIKASQAGTSLRSILSRLANPPKEAAGAMEALGISITKADGTMKPMRQVIDELRKKFNGLTEAESAQMAKSLAGQEAMSGLLAIVNAAPSDYEKLIKAIDNSSGAAQNMADTMNDTVEGQVTLLKSQIEGKMIAIYEKASSQIKESIKKISVALEAIDWDKVGDAVGKFATKAVDLFSYLINNGDTVITILKGVGATIATVFTINKISTFITSIKTLTEAFGSITTATKGAETASLALNTAWLASPVTWLVAGVAALTAGLVVLKKRQDEAIEKEYGLSDAQKESINSSKALANSYREINKAREESTSNINAEYGYIQELKDEYNTLIDSNGKVKKGYEDRANFIINELSKSLGIEQSEIKKLIDENGKLGDSIDKIIQKKKAEAILLASEQAYTEAIQNRQKALEKYQDSLETLDEVEKKYKDTKTKANEVMENYNKLLRINPDDAAMYLASNKKIIDANAKAEESYNKAKKGVSDAEEAYVGYNSTIKNYEGLSSAIISGDTKKIENALMNMENNFITAENGTKDSLERQVKNLQENYNSMEKAIKNNTPGVTKEMVEQAKTMVDNATKELDKFQGKASESTAKAGVLSADALKNKAKDFENAGNLVGNSMVLGMKKHEAPAGKTGKTSGENFVKNVDSNKGKAKNAGDTLGKNAVSGAKNGASSMTSTGKTAGGNFASGVGSQSGNAKGKGNSIGSNAVSGARSGSSKMNSEGKTAGGNFASGVGSQGTKARNEGKGIANDAKSGASSVSARQTGEDFGEGFGRGISNKSNSVWNYAWNLGINALNAIRRATATASPSKKAMEIGGFFSEGFSIGIDKKTKEAVKASASLAKQALKSLNNFSGDFSQIGIESGQSFTNALSQSLSINDVQSQLKGININSGVSNVEGMESSNDASFRQMLSAFKEALSQMEIELDDDKVGSFVDKTVTRLIYT